MEITADDSWTTVEKNERVKTPKAEDVIAEVVQGLPTKIPIHPQPLVVFLVGLPGSGKTLLCRILAQVRPAWIRISQDDLGSKEDCLRVLSQSLQAGQSVVIDRCNLSLVQRRKFLKASRGYPRVALVLEVTPEECIRRCQQRRGHPTLPPHKAPSIVRTMQRERQPLQPRDFQAIVTLRPEDWQNSLSDFLRQY